MGDLLLASLAAEHFNRVTWRQLRDLGLSESTIKRWISSGRLASSQDGVFAIAPLLDHDPWGRWAAATLTHPGTVLSHLSAAVAWGILTWEGELITVTRSGCGGPRRHGTLVAHRSVLLAGEVTELDGIPITTVARTLVDIAGVVSDKALARAVREAVRLELVTLAELGDALGRYRGRRGVRKLAATLARYSGLPLKRARSGAEVRAMEILRDAGRPLPRLNARVGGEEADLSWSSTRLIVEIDGRPFHQDVGEDERKERVWHEAGWSVRRIPSEDVYELPHSLLELAPET